jgi:hypothetical protein
LIAGFALGIEFERFCSLARLAKEASCAGSRFKPGKIAASAVDGATVEAEFDWVGGCGEAEGGAEADCGTRLDRIAARSTCPVELEVGAFVFELLGSTHQPSQSNERECIGELDQVLTPKTQPFGPRCRVVSEFRRATIQLGRLIDRLCLEGKEVMMAMAENVGEEGVEGEIQLQHVLSHMTPRLCCGSGQASDTTMRRLALSGLQMQTTERAI